jgi:hypothetical protein
MPAHRAKEDGMSSGTISEADFLLTELRYTLGQLHVQVLDLDDDSRQSVMCGDRSIEEVLAQMAREEDENLGKYAELLHTSVPVNADETVPLPVTSAEEATGEEGSFERKRARTIALLERAGENWPSDLLNAVREHVQRDRRYTTEIAECRKAYFEADTRPDLNEPLTTSPHPHEKSETTT